MLQTFPDTLRTYMMEDETPTMENDPLLRRIADLSRNDRLPEHVRARVIEAIRQNVPSTADQSPHAADKNN